MLTPDARAGAGGAKPNAGVPVLRQTKGGLQLCRGIPGPDPTTQEAWLGRRADHEHASRPVHDRPPPNPHAWAGRRRANDDLQLRVGRQHGKPQTHGPGVVGRAVAALQRRIHRQVAKPDGRRVGRGGARKQQRPKSAHARQANSPARRCLARLVLEFWGFERHPFDKGRRKKCECQASCKGLSAKPRPVRTGRTVGTGR